MLTFSPLGGTAIRLTGGGKTFQAFPPGKPAVTGSSYALLSSPEEMSSPNTISWPGEYNEGGVSVRGVGHRGGQQVSYVLEIEGVHVAFLSSPLQDWTDQELEMVGDIDVLVLPTDEVKLVQKLVDECDPRVLILLPSRDHANVAKAIGAATVTDEYKLKSQLPAEGREVVVLGK